MGSNRPFNGFKQDVELPFQRISYAKKKANNFKWVEECADYYDFLNGEASAKDKIKRYADNIDIGINGRADIAADYANLFSFKILNETVSYGIQHVVHYPIINQIIEGYAGEHIKRAFVPVAYDVSGNTVNLKKKKHIDAISAYIQQVKVQPKVQQITQEIYAKYQIQDPYSLAPEQQDQLQQEIQQQAAAALPSEINRFMKTEYKSPAETQAQKLIDFLIHDQRIKEKADESFITMLCTGEVYYYVGIRHDMPVFEQINAAYFEWGGSQGVTRSEDGEWAKYTQYLTISEVFNKYGDVFSNMDLKKLSGLLGLSANSTVDDVQLANNTLLEIRTNNPQLADPKTREGQRDMATLFSGITSRLGMTHEQLGEIRVRETNIAYKALRKLLKVRRLTAKGIKSYYLDEDYKFSPEAGDIDFKEIWVPEVWTVTKLGVQDCIYLNKQPLPYQYKSVNDPWNVKLPYVGQRLNSPMGMTKNSSYVDLGKKWNFQFDVFMARIMEKMSTDVGKVLTFMVEAKPENMKWNDWFAMIKYGKMAPVTFKDFMENNGGVNAPIFKAEDLSQAFELAQMIPTLQYFQTQTATSMMYNPSRLGQISPYIPVSNNEQNIAQSSNQTERVFNQHSQILERALSQLMECARIAFKDYDETLTWVLDDGSIAELEIDSEMLHRSKLGVFIATTPQDIENTTELKRYLLEFIQNPTADLKTIISIMYARNKADMINAAELADQRKKEEAQQQQQMAMEQQQMALQAQQQQIQQQNEIKYQMHSETLENKTINAEIDSEKFAKTMDVNQNNQNDMVETKDKEIEYKREKDALDRELEREKLEAQGEDLEEQSEHDVEMAEYEIEIKKLELDIKKQELQNKKNQAKTAAKAKKK